MDLLLGQRAVPALRCVLDRLSLVLGCLKYDNMGMLELGEDLIPQTLAAEDGIAFQHWPEEESETLLLFQSLRRQLLCLAPAQEQT